MLSIALEVYTPKANPIQCLATSGNLGNLHFQQGNWQPAIDAYKLAITAVELSRSWSKDDDRHLTHIPRLFRINSHAHGLSQTVS